MLPILIVQDVVSVWAYRHTWDRRNVVILLLGAISGILTGYLLAAQVSDAAVKLARRRDLRRPSPSAAWWWSAARPQPKPAPADVPRGIFWGWVTGFTSMVAHAGGPPFQIYVMPQRLPRTSSSARARCSSRSSTGSRCRPIWRSGSSRAENMATAARPVPGGDRLHLGRRAGWCGASRASASTRPSMCCSSSSAASLSMTARRALSEQTHSKKPPLRMEATASWCGNC